ncbi:patatin-like phospholipase family protein [Pseudomonas citronellolis]|uniref:patatin-like phospholipase family protein n=1 Tax=Pseudomonas citronellolis TaxID=53408 RepID=UPI0023E3EFD2|nr:patatin-like phospholipase family protein [Pseudomonas citronellolis]MDF3933470.1 patatin-like phospholipase family protein [Pseudomonas citronellolis]
MPRRQGNLRDQEQALLRERRARAGLDAGADFSWGLALSGGGVRSATFNFGLLRALAKNHVLKRFDYLSTVSGGGYIGSALGRLYGPAQGARAVEDGLAADDSLLLWWLRNNGRYLTPAGGRDLLMAGASMLRGFMATQLEIGILLLCVGLLAVLPHALLGLVGTPPVYLGNLWSLWFLSAPLLLLAAGALCWAYWFSRDRQDHALRDLLSVLLALSAAVALAVQSLWPQLQSDIELGPRLLAYATLVGALLIAPLGWLLRLPLRASPPDQQRLRLTHWLGWVLLGGAGVLLLGTCEAATWFLVVRLRESGNFTLVSSGVLGSTGLAVVLLRALLPALLERLRQHGLPNGYSSRLANLFGLALLLFLLLAWLTLLQAFLYLGGNLLSPGAAMQPWLPLLYWGLVLAALGFYIGISGSNLTQLNLASLHYFYRSRLARTYIAVANHGGPDARFPASPLAPAERQLIEGIESLREILPGDDVALADYRPHAYGGPLHLINCCINQTLDDRTHSYNADRKGVALTVSALGVETGTHGPQSAPGAERGSLAQWATISGAALSTGMGSRTATGLAALVFMTGLRLGFWLPNPTQAAAGGWRARLAKYLATRAEMLAQFPGLRGPYWYLSDGGHFDNSGVYALLKREVDLIVASDCGADPNYLFEDLENLVRKAKIDYDADIEFIDPASLVRASGNDARALLFGTPESISPECGREYLLLARVTYASHRRGTLLVVKPHRCDSPLLELPFDLVGYADRNPDFPQQSTGDQFFDESQWEAYHQLGLALGSVLNREFLQRLPNWADLASIVTLGGLGQPAPAAAALSRRQRIAQGVRTTLGVGLSASLVVALWQGWEQYRGGVADNETKYANQLEAIADLYAKANTVSDALRTRIGHLENFASRSGLSVEFASDMRTLFERASTACANGAESADCNYLRQLTSDPHPNSPVQQYWFGFTALPEDNPALLGAAPSPPPAPPVSAEVAPSPPPSVAAEAPPAAPGNPCEREGRRPVVLYTQIYSPDEQRPARDFLKQLEGSGISTPGIENVVSAASRRGSPPPLPWPRPTFIYHARRDGECARWLAQKFSDKAVALPLAASLQASPGVIEFWLPAQGKPN